MIPTTKMSSVRNADKAILFIAKKWCSNCEKTKPILEKFEKENPDVLIFSHEAESPNDEILKELPPIRIFPWVFCLKSGKIVSVTNAIPSYELLTIWFLSVSDKYAHFWKVTREITQAENYLKWAKEFHQFIDQSISLEEVKTETDFLPTQTATTSPVELCESCQ